MKIETPYYEDNTRISNSAIGWFLEKGPRYLRDMLDGKEEGIKGKYLEKGTMIHMWLLQPEDFWNNYTILDFEAPKVKQQKDFCEFFAEAKKLEPLEDIDVITLKSYRQSYSNNLKDDAALTKATELRETFRAYIEYLDMKDTKNIISYADLRMLQTIRVNVDSHKMADALLYDTPGMECHNEFHINWEYKKYGIACKSLLDRVKFDHVNRKITLIDIKTAMDVYDFKHSVETRDYYRQLAYYLLAITWYFMDQEIDISEYTLECYIVAIQNNGKYEVRVFDMNDEAELLLRKSIIAEALSEISYHFETGNWDHTREYYEGDGIERLK